MARKSAVITITDEGRDKGKIFLITEMPARRAEEWATRALMICTKNGVQVPDNVAGAGFIGIASVAFQALAGANYTDVKPLFDEMMQCVQVRPDARRPEVVRALIDNGTEGDDIEEVATRLKLRAEIFSLHTGFWIPGVSSTTSTTALTPADSPTTKTSPRRSGRASPPGVRRS